MQGVRSILADELLGVAQPHGGVARGQPGQLALTSSGIAAITACRSASE
jgi:hypothetical protein